MITLPLYSTHGYVPTNAGMLVYTDCSFGGMEMIDWCILNISYNRTNLEIILEIKNHLFFKNQFF